MTNIGEIRSGRELGYSNRYLMVWAECLICHKGRWVKLTSNKKANYTSLCSICYGRRSKKWNAPFRKDVLHPQIGDISRVGMYRGVDIFIACPDCGGGHWSLLRDVNSGIIRRCFSCGLVAAHLHKRTSEESKFPSRLSNAIRANIRDAVHRKGGDKKERGWEQLVGYTINDLMKHLQKRFTEGMTWDNYGEWHIDHIIPVSKFNFTSTNDFDFKRCWALSNLQPLWAKENLQKHTDILTTFQPSFKIK